MNVVITGTNKGLGLCLVKTFIERGHRVLAGMYEGDDKSQLEAFASVNEGGVVIVPMDVSDEGSVNLSARIACDIFGSIDILINNAGILLPKDRENLIYNVDVKDLKKSLEVNTIGTVIMMKEFLPLMRDDGKGTMIFITSEAGSMSNSGSNFPSYSISKAAANKAVFILRATVGERYRIFAVHPGRMNTEMGRTTAQIEPEESADGIYRIATGITEVGDIGFINYKGEPMTI
ncbi:MAG: hypothetical protein PWP48_630 [Clostridiales bacterium]|jgi:NAD(P)-dependent dehydrogenase (short-subunit alcohol dehydrogenase family)|nr:hypothetical protein [Clostridiales bacterium]